MATCHDQIFPSSTDTEIPDQPSVRRSLSWCHQAPLHQHQCLCYWFTLEAPHPQTTTPGLSLPPQKFNFCSRGNANFSFKLFPQTEREHNGSLRFSQKKYKTETKQNKKSWQIHFAVRAQGAVGTTQAQAAQYIQDYLKILDIWDIKCEGPGQTGKSWSWPRQNLSHYTITSACIQFWKSEIPPPSNSWPVIC